MKANPRRLELVKLSRAFKPLVESGKFAKMNDAILAYYTQQTGKTEWHTFNGWKEKGFQVVKGATGFPVWGTPRRMDVPEGARIPDIAVVAMMQGAELQGPEFFPVCYLFHDGQVIAAEAAKAAA